MTNCVGRTEISLCANVRLRQQKLFLAIFSLPFLDLLSNMGGLLLRGRTDPFGAFLLRFSNFTEYFWGVGRKEDGGTVTLMTRKRRLARKSPCRTTAWALARSSRRRTERNTWDCSSSAAAYRWSAVQS